MIQSLLARWQKYRYDRRRHWLAVMLSDPKSGMGTLLQNRAMEMALLMVSNWLDKKRILHCARCPSTESLKSYREKYWCEGHYRQVASEDSDKDKFATVTN